MSFFVFNWHDSIKRDLQDEFKPGSPLETLSSYVLQACVLSMCHTSTSLWVLCLKRTILFTYHFTITVAFTSTPEWESFNWPIQTLKELYISCHACHRNLSSTKRLISVLFSYSTPFLRWWLIYVVS